MRSVVRLVAFALAALGGAQASEDRDCASQYSFDEQMILEWAALGGDPHAQFAMARCASAGDPGNMTPAKKTYALKWLMLASCDASGHGDRDRALRRLKYDGDLSFRRFGGITKDETWTPREKKFIEFREQEISDLQRRFDGFASKVGEEELQEARDALSDQMARLGDLGLVRLTEMTSCKNFGATRVLTAAAWSAAAQAWKASDLNEVYGASGKHGWDPASESAARLAELSPMERRAADLEKTRLLKTEPATLAKLEDEAALGRLEELAFVHVASGDAVFSGRSVTTAIQYALEALGMIEFVNGPDNDYGPSTIEAAKRAQSFYGRDQTRWLSHEEVRQIVCDAATKKSDPISYFHLGVMFSEGWGYKKDLDRASYAIDRAQRLLDSRLARFDSLATWKQSEYPSFAPKIEQAKSSIDDARASQPKRRRSDRARIDDGNLCN